MGKESMGEFLESAAASVLRFEHSWQTVIENYHLLRPESLKKKHEPKVSSIEIDVFAYGYYDGMHRVLPKKPYILAPHKLNEILLVQCKDEWYEHEHIPATKFLYKAEEIVRLHYPSPNVRKVIVTLLLAPKALESLRDSDIQIICNVAHLNNRIRKMRVSEREREKLKDLLDEYVQNGTIGDLRYEIVYPLLGQIYQHIKRKNQTSLTNFPSLAMQCFRFFVNLNHFSDDTTYFPFISDNFDNVG